MSKFEEMVWRSLLGMAIGLGILFAGYLMYAGFYVTRGVYRTFTDNDLFRTRCDSYSKVEYQGGEVSVRCLDGSADDYK